MANRKENKKLLRIGILYITVLILLAYFMPKKQIWISSYSKEVNWPFGASVLFEQIPKLFDKQDIKVIDKSYYQSWKDTSHSEHNLLIISDYFYPDSFDMDRIYKFVSEGNQAMIVSEDFDYYFLDSLGFEMDYGFKDDIDIKLGPFNTILGLNFDSPSLKKDTAYRFNGMRYYNYFYKTDSLKPGFSLGRFDTEEVNFLRIPFGKGNFFLHSYPLAFTNYALLNEDLQSYISKSLSYLPRQNLIWDEYFKPNKVTSKTTPLYVLLQSRSFKWAYWLSFIGLFLFILFYAKRKQRIIPVIKPYKNDSMNFVKTISALYLQNKNNRDLALKKINYFRDYLNHTYHFRGLKFSEEFAEELSQKSNFEEDYVKRLFRQIRNIQSNSNTSDAELQVLTEKMNHIYNRK